MKERVSRQIALTMPYESRITDTCDRESLLNKLRACEVSPPPDMFATASEYSLDEMLRQGIPRQYHEELCEALDILANAILIPMGMTSADDKIETLTKSLVITRHCTGGLLLLLIKDWEGIGPGVFRKSMFPQFEALLEKSAMKLRRRNISLRF
jgi:hypothetical protein